MGTIPQGKEAIKLAPVHYAGHVSPMPFALAGCNDFENTSKRHLFEIPPPASRSALSGNDYLNTASALLLIHLD